MSNKIKIRFELMKNGCMVNWCMANNFKIARWWFDKNYTGNYTINWFTNDDFYMNAMQEKKVRFALKW